LSVFSLKKSHVSAQHQLVHFQSTIPIQGLSTALLYASDNYVFSYVAPGCVLYQWNATTKSIENRLDCSKLVPCSESLKSIAIDEHLSPGKCQISAIAALNKELYVGTTWGCLIIAEKTTLRPITIFRPFEEDVRCILPIFNTPTPKVITIGRGYRSLIDRYTDLTTGQVMTPTASTDKRIKDSLLKDRSNHMHALVWNAEHWQI
jgi:hypothetical protein